VKKIIFSLLQDYRRYLEGRYSPATASTYYKRICTLFEGQNVVSVADRPDFGRALERLAQIKYKNQFSQAKNALLKFCEFRKIALPADFVERVEELEKSTRKKYRKLKPVDYADIDRKIKGIKNQKLKISFQVLTATGLRISELAGIRFTDCTVTDEQITFGILAKGQKKESVTINKADYPQIFQRTKELIKTTPAHKKVFYSAVYLQGKAKELGFTCHDLRRACAKLEYKKTRSKNEVKKKLRHSNIKTTNIYLKSKVEI